MLSHSVKDFCIVGPRGCGKSILADRLATLLGYEVEPVQLYQDMTARDLLQQRSTLQNGDTVWRYLESADSQHFWPILYLQSLFCPKQHSEGNQ